MKKILFGLLALSVATMASNPGNETGASVPVRVMAEVVAPTEALVITDEAGTTLDEILLNHQIIAGAAGTTSQKQEVFLVKKLSGEGVVDTAEDGSLTISLDTSVTTLTSTSGTGTLTSNLRLIGDGLNGNTVSTNLKAGQYTGTIVSAITITDTTAGVYDNKQADNKNMPTLTVTYSAQ